MAENQSSKASKEELEEGEIEEEKPEISLFVHSMSLPRCSSSSFESPLEEEGSSHRSLLETLRRCKASKEELEEGEIEEDEEIPLFVPSMTPSRGCSSFESLLEDGSSHRSVSETLTLASPISVTGNERYSSDCPCFSKLLAEAMAEATPVNSAVSGLDMKTMPVSKFSVDSQSPFSAVALPCFPVGFQFGMSHQEALASVTAQAQMKLQAAHSSSSSGLPLNSLIPSVLSAFNPILQQQRSQPLFEDNSTSETGQHPSSDQKSQSNHVVAKKPSGDCYNWRKYGQKQVKGNEGSRSYYRCTHADCHVRKNVVRCYSGHVKEVIYKGQHNHDPPQKIRCPKGSRLPSGGPFEESKTANLPGKEINGSHSSIPMREWSSGLATSVLQLHYSRGCDGSAANKVNEEPKRRIKYPKPPMKTARNAKVVQTASDPGMLEDGYKWRKYGQKLVKGNPKPRTRSYYKCTYDGCRVRKHVEKASDDAKALVLTYEGKHNHERPTSKSSYVSHGTALLIAAAAAITARGQLTPSNPMPVEEPTTQFPSDRKDEVMEKALELGGEKALESAQTLLSIGFNLNSSEAESEAKNRNVIKRPFFNGNNAVVSV